MAFYVFCPLYLCCGFFWSAECAYSRCFYENMESGADARDFCPWAKIPYSAKIALDSPLLIPQFLLPYWLFWAHYVNFTENNFKFRLNYCILFQKGLKCAFQNVSEFFIINSIKFLKKSNINRSLSLEFLVWTS